MTLIEQEVDQPSSAFEAICLAALDGKESPAIAISSGAADTEIERKTEPRLMLDENDISDGAKEGKREIGLLHDERKRHDTAPSCEGVASLASHPLWLCQETEGCMDHSYESRLCPNVDWQCSLRNGWSSERISSLPPLSRRVTKTNSVTSISKAGFFFFYLLKRRQKENTQDEEKRIDYDYGYFYKGKPIHSSYTGWRIAKSLNKISNTISSQTAGWLGERKHYAWACNKTSNGSQRERLKWDWTKGQLQEWKTSLHATVKHIPNTYSDHTPFLIDLFGAVSSPTTRRPFRFQAAWLTHRGFYPLVCENVHNDMEFSAALEGLTAKVKWWNSNVFGNIHWRKKRI
uniref:Uncharacterized protein n=1 Tax=Ananas comosus var. bracteatus TaxID=296719 RepID=A0A6V7PYN0_ANACO|nr:unnamed protein product [Ananas comosus var. bracteatus]